MSALYFWPSKTQVIKNAATGPNGFPKDGKDYSYRINRFSRDVVFKAERNVVIEWIRQRGYTNKGYSNSEGGFHNITSKSVRAYIDDTMIVEIDALDNDDIYIMNRASNGGGYNIGYDGKDGICVFSWSRN